MTKEIEQMECPCPCEKCGVWFDLHDGKRSDKWFPNTVICYECGTEEEVEIDRDEEIEQLELDLENAEYEVKRCKERLTELGYYPPEAK